MAEEQRRRGLPRAQGGPSPDGAAPTRRSGLPRPPAGVATKPHESAHDSTTGAPAEPPARAAAHSPRPLRVRVRTKTILLGAAAAVLLAAMVLTSRWFLHGTRTGADFLDRYPGTTPLPAWAPRGLPVWLEWQHFLNAFFIVLVIRTGWMYRTDKRPIGSWQPRRGDRKIALKLFAHLSVDVVWLVNGVLFIVMIFCTGQWARIVPTDWGVIPNAVSALLQYLSLNWPHEDGWINYNSLQLLSYFATVFVAAPVAVLTGFRMSPLWPARAKALTKAYPIELARALHFPTMLYFVVFVIIHVGLVLTTGPLRNLNHMYGHQDGVNWWGLGVFILSLVVTVAGWLAIRPITVQQFGALLGKVGR